MTEPNIKNTTTTYSQFACIGTGLSAIALGATLKRWYQMDDIRFFERHGDCGGTWHINSYPGCACDVPSALYSFSFALNPKWTKLMPSYKEMKAYQDEVIKTYRLREKMVFRTEVQECTWQDHVSRWLMTIKNLDTNEIFYHECQILFAATGQLLEPRPCDIPNASSFKGSIFHSARWNHDVNLEGKRVVVVGNGCTAAQIVPSIVDCTESLTQIVRSKHWVFPAHNFSYPKVLQWILRFFPLAMRLHRFHIFLVAESDFLLFPMNKLASFLRRVKRRRAEYYMRKTAPAKYHDLLVPNFDVGCKRRIFDCGYLKSLHKEKLVLTDSKIVEIAPDGVVTTGGFIPADVIVLATGFQTNKFVPYTEIKGRHGTTLDEHWSRHDGPGAYNCSIMSGFPNFFLLLGPNAATGHTSAIMAAENSINYALRVLKPVLNGDAAHIDLKLEAEDKYIFKVQDTLRTRVWHSGCNSWYINEKNWNAMAYPWSQGYYWWSSLFPNWSHWNIKKIQKPKYNPVGRVLGMLLAVFVGTLVVGWREPSIWKKVIESTRKAMSSYGM